MKVDFFFIFVFYAWDCMGIGWVLPQYCLGIPWVLLGFLDIAGVCSGMLGYALICLGIAKVLLRYCSGNSLMFFYYKLCGAQL